MYIFTLYIVYGKVKETYTARWSKQFWENKKSEDSKSPIKERKLLPITTISSIMDIHEEISNLKSSVETLFELIILQKTPYNTVSDNKLGKYLKTIQNYIISTKGLTQEEVEILKL